MATLPTGANRLAGVPPELLSTIFLGYRYMPVELDGVRHVQTLNLPGVAEIEPVVWLLVLEAVHDALRRSVTERALICRRGPDI